MEKLLYFNNVRELINLISQIDNEQKENLLTIFRFLNVCESSKANQEQNNYKKVEKTYYAPLVASLNKCDYKVEINIFQNLLEKIFTNLISTGTHIDLLKYFIKVTPYGQNNLLNIVKFVCYSQKNKLDKKNYISQTDWNKYRELIKKIKSLPINEHI